MKLSEAMDLGRALEPMNMSDYRSCALGVGLAALGVPFENRGTDELVRRWPWLKNKATSAPFPSYGRFGESWYQEISHGAIQTRNCRGCNFDQLLDWVRSIEPAEEEPQQVPVQEKQAKEVAA